MPVTDVLQLDDVEIRVGGRTVLEHLQFSVAPGEFVGVIGPNGAGKTTLLRAILGLSPISKGTLIRSGQTATRKLTSVGYVPQKLHLDEDAPLRGRDLALLGLDGHKFGIGWPSKAKRQLVLETLADVDALHLADAPVGRLSGGEQQRLLIAQALLANPELLLLDEPLSNLDIRSAHEVVRLVAKVARERDIAVMLVAHDINPLVGHLDSVLYVAGGKAVKGSVDDVIQKEVLSRLYGYDVDVIHARGRILVVGGGEVEEENASEFPVFSAEEVTAK